MDLAPLYPPRKPDARKGDFGHVLVAAGSERYAGAAAFNALAALAAGADLVTVVAPRRAADLVASYAPDLITVPCDAPFPAPAAVLGLAERCDALVVGSGVERTAVAHEALRQILHGWRKPMVLDAEALHAARPELVQGKPAVLTPHGGEFAALAGEPWPDAQDARERACRQAARRWGATVLVKGHLDVVSDGERVHVDREGSPYLTKGGHGDLLAGVAGALLARKASPWDAARAAAFIVGAAGARAAAERGESTLASDTLREIPRALPRA